MDPRAKNGGARWARRWLAAALLVAAARAGAANGWREIGFGPVQRSMGGAAVGAPLDAATLVSNPAGLALLGRRVDAGASWTRSTSAYAAPGTFQSSEPVQTAAPAAGAVLPIDGRFTVGVGAFEVSRLASDYRPGFFYGRYAKSSYRELRFTPAAAWRLDERFAVGLTLDLAAARMGYTAPAAATSVSQFPRDPATALGVGATLGLLWRPVAPLTVGLALETPTRHGEFTWHVPSTPIGFDGALVGGTERLSLDTPASAALGASWRFATVLVAADVQWIGWSSTRGVFSTDPATTGAMPLDLGWSDQWVVKVGAQWAATPALRVRAGYAGGRSPLGAGHAADAIAFPALAEHHVTVSAGWSIGPVTVAVAAAWSPEARKAGADPASGISAYEATASQVAFDLGLGWEL